MAKEKEITATEKLLEMIRREEEAAREQPDAPDTAASLGGPMPDSQLPEGNASEQPPLTLESDLPASSSPPLSEPALQVEREPEPQPEPLADPEIAPEPENEPEPEPESPLDLRLQNESVQGEVNLPIETEDETEEDEAVPVADNDKGGEAEDFENGLADLGMEGDEKKGREEKPRGPVVMPPTGLQKLKAVMGSFGTSGKGKIGVDIQEDCINLARLAAGNLEPSLTNFLSVPIDKSQAETDGPIFRDPSFIRTLSTTLSSFAHRFRRPELWCSFAPGKAEIHNIVIPKVPAKELANAVFWGTRKEIEFDPAEFVFDFTVVKEVDEGKQKKIVTLVYLIPRKELTWLKDLFQRVGYPLTGLTIASSAVGNMLSAGFLSKEDRSCVHLYFDRENSHIDLYFQGAMLFSRGIKTGIHSFVEAVFDAAAEEDMILDDKSAQDLVFYNARQMLIGPDAIDAAESSEIAGMVDLQEMAVTGRLVRQLSRTFDYCTTNFRIPKANKLYVSGAAVPKSWLLREVETEIDIPCTAIDLFRADGERQGAELPPEELAGMSPLTSFGLAMSDTTSTQNFLFTFSDKKRQALENRVNQIIGVVTIILALLCGAVFFQQYGAVQKKEKEVQALNNQLLRTYQVDPRTKDTSFALLATKKISDILSAYNRKSERFKVIALISEVFTLVPGDMKLTDFRLNLPKKKIKGRGRAATKNEALLMHGFVGGATERQDFLLLDFLKKLERLEYVEGSEIRAKKSGLFQGSDILHFTVIVNTKEDAF